MMKVLLSAYACDPSKGSEAGNGFHWAMELARQGLDVYCLTTSKGKEQIESRNDLPANLHFFFVNVPRLADKLYSYSQVGMYTHYLLWQWMAYKRGKELHKIHRFNLAHHVTWGSIHLGSFLYKLRIPFIFGPVGGGQSAPVQFHQYFGKHWKSEKKREWVGKLLSKWSPASKLSLQRANVVLVTNAETNAWAKLHGARNIAQVFDAGLSNSFFPKINPVRSNEKGVLNLLWVGRFLPRKGIQLVLEAMALLKNHQGIHLTVVGDGEMKEVFLSKIKTLGLEKKIVWKGKVSHEEVKKFYASHDAFIFTSLRDSCPAQLMEAMAYGLPVITLDLHGQGAIINDSLGLKCSIDVPQTTIQELAKHVLHLAFDKIHLNNLSANAFHFAKEQTWEKKVKMVVSNYYN